jgi:sensor histidine kinase YesM
MLDSRMRIKKILWHCLAWAIWIAPFVYLYMDVAPIYFWDQFFFHGIHIAIFYFSSNYSFPKYYRQNNALKLFIWFLLGSIIFLLLKYVTDYAFLNILDPSSKPLPYTLGNLISRNIGSYFFYSVAGGIYFYLKKYFEKKRELVSSEKEKNELQKHNFQLQQEKWQIQQSHLLLEKKQIETENAYLRAQINPHFLHNTLNFFFSKSINVGAFDLADAIMVLSNVMRFSLEAKPDENGRVEVAHEMEHMKNVIKINEIRFNKAYCLDLKIDGDVENAKIIPLVLITMVENAFKYGELFDPEHPLKIHINVGGYRFRFYLHNKKRQGGAQEASHGIGVDNSIKRLTAAYGPDGYAIDIQQDPVFYSVTLTIFDLAMVQDDVNAVTEKVLP